MAFVDTSLHKNTKSGDFLRELFAPHFEITNFWDDAWETDEHIPPEILNKYDYVFYEQTINSFDDLKKITAKIIWAPMYDGVDFSFSFWKSLSYFNIKAICFSKKLYDICRRYNIDAVYAQYYLNPALLKADIPTTGRHLFFWHRTGITFNKLKKIISPNQVDSFKFRSCPDPATSKESISEDDVKDYKIKILSDTFIPKQEYLASLASTNIFIAPRKREGIGMSFIEALAMGQCVLAHNDSTMNEYITDGEDGYLFNIDNPKTIDLSNVALIIENSRKRAAAGYLKWQKSKQLIIDFATAPTKRTKPSSPFLRATLETYYKFHVRKKFFIRSLYRNFYKLTRRRLIVVRLQGGLGNQLFQYAAGRAMAMASGTNLKLDIGFYDKSRDRSFLLNNFNIRAGIASRTDIVIKKVLKRVFGMRNQYLEDYYQGEKYFKDIQKDLREEFTPKRPLGPEAQEVSENISKCEAVSLHVRRGDYVYNDKLKNIIQPLPMTYYLNAVEVITKKVKDPSFFIFSDDVEWVKNNLKLLSPVTYVSQPEITDFEELELMSLCKHNIVANSSFSWWGAWLNRNPNKVVIAPQKWFNYETNDTRDLIPQSWIKM